MKKIIKSAIIAAMVLAIAMPAFAQIGYDMPPSTVSEPELISENGAKVSVELYEYEASADGTYKTFDSDTGVAANDDLRFAVKVTLPSRDAGYCDVKNPCVLDMVINNVSFAPVCADEGDKAEFIATSAEGVYTASVTYAPDLIAKGGSFTYMFTTQAQKASAVTVNATLSGGRSELPMKFIYGGKTYDIEGVERENFTVYADNSYGMVINADDQSMVTGIQIFDAEYSNQFFDVVSAEGGVTFKNGNTSYVKGDPVYDKLYADYETIMGILGFSEGENAYIYTSALVNRFNTEFSFSASGTFKKAGSIIPPATSGNSLVAGFLLLGVTAVLCPVFFYKKLRKA